MEVTVGTVLHAVVQEVGEVGRGGVEGDGELAGGVVVAEDDVGKGLGTTLTGVPGLQKGVVLVFHAGKSDGGTGAVHKHYGLAGLVHGANQALLYGGKFDVGLVTAFAFHLGGDTADHQDDVGLGGHLLLSGEVGVFALAEVGAEHGEGTCAPAILDFHVDLLTGLYVKGLVLDTAAAEAESAHAAGGGLGVLYHAAVHLEDVAVVGGHGVAHGTGEIRDILALDADGDLVGGHALGKAVCAEGAEVQGIVVPAHDRLAFELVVVEELHEHALALVEFREVIDGVVVVGQLAGLGIQDGGSGDGGLDAVQQAVGVGFGGGAAVVAVQQGCIVGVGAYYQDGSGALGQRQHAVVLQQDHGFTGGLGGQGVVFLAADHVFSQVGPGQHVGRVEHAQLEAAAKGAAQVLVQVGLADHTLLQGLGEGHHGFAAFQVGAVQGGVYRGVQGIGLGLVLAGGEVVVDGVAVGEDDGFVSPLVAEDIGQEAVVGAAGNAFVAVVGAHDLADVTVHHQGLEGGQVGFKEVPLRNACVIGVAERFGTAVYGIVLGAGVGLVVAGIVSLHAQDGLEAQDTGQIRVFPAGFLAATPARVTEDVHVGAPEGEFRIAGVVGHAHRHVEDVVVGAVPVGTGLVGYLGEYLVHLLGVEGGGHADRLRIHRVAVGPYAVAGLAPPVVGGDAQAVDGDGLVHHQAHFLLGGEQGDEILYPVFNLKLRVLEGILIGLLGAAGGQQNQSGSG